MGDRVRIYGTLGPSCSREDTLFEMFGNGMTGIRLNLSHTGLAGARDTIRRLGAAAARAHVMPELLIDLQGSELRLGVFDPVEAREGGLVRFGAGGIPVRQEVLSAMERGQELLIDDGRLRLLVTEADGESAVARVERGGPLLPGKSVALPGKTILLPLLTERDLEDLALAGELGVTGVMQPFVRSGEDVRFVREAVFEHSGGGIRLFAKIERAEALERLNGILSEADEIVIARGDLGNSMPLWQLPAAQKRIARTCLEAGKPFMVVTQMLHSMTHSPVPTRAEVSDIFNAVLDGASSVMVTGETAVGEYPAEVIRVLANTVREAEAYRDGLPKATDRI